MKTILTTLYHNKIAVEPTERPFKAVVGRQSMTVNTEPLFHKDGKDYYWFIPEPMEYYKPERSTKYNKDKDPQKETNKSKVRTLREELEDIRISLL